MAEDERPEGQEPSEDPTVAHPTPGTGVPRESSAGEPPAAAAPPDSIGPFRILGKLGEGGMGVVYEAEQDHPRRRVALKLIRAGSLANEHQIRMFQREADALARLKHPGIAGIHQAGKTDDGHPYFVMELVRGKPLDEYLAGRPPITSRTELESRLRLFRQICDAVHYAHQRGIIHRDLKPTNVLVVETAVDESSTSSSAGTARAKILDFGLARVTDADATQVTEVGLIKGTLQYMSPEQTRGRPDEIDIRTDVYALGALLYEMLAGKRPYDLEQEAIAEAVRIICEQSPEPLRSSWSAAFRPDPDIETIVGKALEKEPDRRYASVAAFAEDVERYLASQPILARPPSAAYQLRKMVGRHRTLFAVAATALMLIVAAAIVSTVLFIRAERAAERARVEAAKSEEVAAFMTEMLQSVGPAVARGRDTTMLREILDDTVDRIDEELQGSPEVAQVLQSRIAQTYFDLSELEPAEELYRSALEKSMSVHGPDHPDTLTEMNSLALVLAVTDRLEESEALFRQTLEGRRRVLEAGHPDIGASLLYLANLLYDQSRLEEAEPLYFETLDILRAAHPEGDHVLGIALNSMGNMYHSMSRLDEAEALYREALEMHTRLLGEDHPDVLVDLHNLAYLMKNRGDLEAAEQMFLDIIEAQRRILGEEHRNIATTIQSLGAVRQTMGDFAGAEERYREALAMTARGEGEDSASYARVLNSTALSLNLLGKREDAERMFRQALEIQRRILGDENETVAMTRGNLAGLLISTQRYDEAGEQLTESIRVLTALYGEDHPDTLVALNDLGRLQRTTGRLDLAEETLRRVLEVRLRTLGTEDAFVARSQYELGLLMIERGGADNVAQGEQLLRDSIATYIAARGESYPAVPSVRYRLGRQLRKRGAYEEAEALLLSSHPGIVEAYGAEHGNVAKVVEEIVALYDAWGKPQQAAEWRSP